MSASRKVKEYIIIEPKIYKITMIKSTTPSGAAKKVYSKFIRSKETKNGTDPSYHIVKIQNIKNGKHFEYEVHEVQKHDIVTRGNKDIPYTYNVIVKSKNIHKSDVVKKDRSSLRVLKKDRSNSTSKYTLKSRSRSRSRPRHSKSKSRPRERSCSRTSSKKICFFRKKK